MDDVEMGDGPFFDHERLHVYRYAREAFRLVAKWSSRKMSRDVRDQLDRSMISVLSNIAEGAGKAAKADKQRFYEIAKGSTLEAAAQVEMLHLALVIDAAEYAAARKLLVDVARMLHGLCGKPRKT
jgi:four helix bundle protein